MANKKARVLVDTRIGDLSLQPNDVIEAPTSVIKSLGDNVDANKAAVAFCIDQPGSRVVVLNDSGNDSDDDQDDDPNGGDGDPDDDQGDQQ
ncbi:MAG: hypothetical protein KF908_05265 [Nitrosomonas sp.]|nr:hypothetical protein [Nitrosomonas sp.]